MRHHPMNVPVLDRPGPLEPENGNDVCPVGYLKRWHPKPREQKASRDNPNRWSSTVLPDTSRPGIPSRWRETAVGVFDLDGLLIGTIDMSAHAGDARHRLVGDDSIPVTHAAVPEEKATPLKVTSPRHPHPAGRGSP
jgi:hypothetical protein